MMRLIEVKLYSDDICKEIIILGSETRNVIVLRERKSRWLKEVIKVESHTEFTSTLEYAGINNSQVADEWPCFSPFSKVSKLRDEPLKYSQPVWGAGHESSIGFARWREQVGVYPEDGGEWFVIFVNFVVVDYTVCAVWSIPLRGAVVLSAPNRLLEGL